MYCYYNNFISANSYTMATSEKQGPVQPDLENSRFLYASFYCILTGWSCANLQGKFSR